MSLTNPEKIVTEERLNEYHQTILPYLGGMPDILANKFAKGDLYSTDEKMIGQWVDGKPVYQKTVDCGALPNNTLKTVAHNISNMDRCISISGYAYAYQVPEFIPLPFTTPSGTQYIVEIKCNLSDIKINTKYNMSEYTESYVTIQYTKTTDSAVAIGNDTDYSTDEKIVGTWVDDKPIYQRTWTNISTPSSQNTDVTVIDLSSLNIDTVVNYFGFIKTVGELNIYHNTSYKIETRIETNAVVMNVAGWISKPTSVTIQYTKTS